MRHLLTLLLLLLVLPTLRTHAQSAAQLAPANTQVLVEISDLADWFDALTQGPEGQWIREQLDTDPQWAGLMALLDMDTDTFIQAYFGGDVVIFGTSLDDDAPGVTFTQVDAAHTQLVRERLFLEPLEQVGPAMLYLTADGGGVIAIFDGWIGMCDLESLDYLKQVLAHEGPSLVDTPAYTYWTGLLPEDRAATVFFSESAEESHVISAARTEHGVDISYFGKSDSYLEIVTTLGQATAVGFGPLPAETLAAISVNFSVSDEIVDEIDDEMAAVLEMLAAPASFSDDIVTKLGSPMVLFVSSVPGDQVEPNIDHDVSVAGIAIKLDDESVAADLQRMLDNTMLIANLATTQWQVGPIRMTQGDYQASSYRVAHVGKLIAQYTGQPEIEAIQLVYGQVDDYYVVCTQEAYFRQCVDAVADDRRVQLQLEGSAGELATRPIFAAIVHPEGFARMLQSWPTLIGNEELLGDLAQEIDSPELAELAEVIDLLGLFDSVKMQLWEGQDDLIIGRFELTLPF